MTDIDGSQTKKESLFNHKDHDPDVVHFDLGDDDISLILEQEDNRRYHACCNLFHVKKVACVLAIFKIIILTFILIYGFLYVDNDLWRLFGVFGFTAATVSNILLIAGVHFKKYIFVIPYFTVCVLFIFLLILQLFWDFLSSVNHSEAQASSLLHNLFLVRSYFIIVQTLIILFEAYTMSIVWRAFVYICDCQMEHDVEVLVRKKTVCPDIHAPLLIGSELLKAV